MRPVRASDDGAIASPVRWVAGLSRTGVCRCAPDKITRITLPGGFETRLSIYDKGGPAPRAGLVVAHGNTWMGSNLSTYRLLASRLAEKGHIVVTLDFPGFGRSADPFGQGPSAVADAYDRPAQLHAAIDYLIANTQVDRSNISLFGHSGGANWAMRAAISHSDVARVAIMVAPPPATEGDSDRDTPEYAVRRGNYFAHRFTAQHRFVYGTDIPEWLSWDMTLHDVRYGDDVWALFADPGHKPILLVLGERDQPDGHEAVLAQFASVAGAKNMLLLTRADHYANTAQSLGFVFYDIDVAAQLVDGLSAWLETSG
jgi:pimeloyl-ACP methyl ester carboxylesterase